MIQTLNLWGDRFLGVAGPMLWQSSLLIAVIFALDIALRQRVRAAVRYALWLLVLVKLLLPPSFASPTGLAWWLPRSGQAALPSQPTEISFVVKTLHGTDFVTPAKPRQAQPPPRLSLPGWVFLGWASASLGLAGWLLMSWRQISRQIGRATPAPVWLDGSVSEAMRQAGWDRPLETRLGTSMASPAVCGLLRPRLLLPKTLVERLPATQLRAVLLHEFTHLRRRDVWVNCAQSLLQIPYWWHPLIWMANARMRRLREEAVDDAVMVALGNEAESYAPTLLEVAKLALNRPRMTLGLVGILESKSALHQRIERLLNFRPPRKAGLTLISSIAVLVFGAVAAPMGQGPIPPTVAQNQNIQPESSGAANIKAATNSAKLETRVYKLDPIVLRQGMERSWGITGTNLSEQLKNFFAKLGVNLDPATAEGAGKNVFYSERNGLYVRATPQDLDLIEKALLFLQASLNPAPRQQQDAPEFKADPNQKANNQMIEEQRGHVPSPDDQGRAGQVAEDKTRSMELVQDGRLLYELGIYDEAEAKMKQAVALYPENKAAAYYINLAREARFSTAARPREIETNKSIIKVQQAWAPPASREDLPGPYPSGVRTNLIFNSKNRQSIVRKLGLIRMDTLSTPTDGLTLGEVIRNLSEEARKRDPEKRGINFLINPNTDGAGTTGPVGDVNPTTGMPIPAAAAAPAEQVDINGVNIKVNPALSDLTLQEALDVILKAADKPIKYSIEDYGIVFSLEGRDAPVLETRIYRVDPDTFRRGLEGISGISRTNLSAENLSAQLRSFFSTLGVSLDPAIAGNAGKNVFLNQPGNTLFVRATPSDLDLIEKAIESLNQAPQQVHIKARFVEITMKGGKNPFERILHDVLNLPARSTKSSVVSSDNAANWLELSTRILTEAQFRKLLAALEQRDGVDTLAAPEVTTLSGRRAEIQFIEFTNMMFRGDGHIVPGNPSAGANHARNYADSIPIGPVLDVVANVAADGQRIELDVIPTLIEFMGWDQSAALLPSYKLRQAKVDEVVKDGQTVVIFGTPALANSAKRKDLVNKQLIIFVTPTLIDPAGNRVHSESEER